MKKRLTALIMALAIVFTCSGVSADYYQPVEKSGEMFDEIINFKTDADKTAEDIKSALQLFEKGGKSEDIFKILDKYNEFYPLELEETLANIRSSLENTEENNAYYTKIYNLLVDSSDNINRMIKGMAESDKYRADLIKWLETDEEGLNRYISEMPTDREYTLLKEINALTEQYYNSQEGFPKIESYDDYVSYLKGMTEKTGGIFVEMVAKRNEIAKLHGYENYADYAYDNIYNKDYTKEERSEFYRNTQKYIVPLSQSLAVGYSAIRKDYSEERTNDEIVADTRKYLEKINPELTEAFDYMKEHELYTLDASPQKQTGCYTTYIDYFSVPFIFINPDGYNLQSTFIHEYGHYTAEFHDPFNENTESENQLEQTSSNMDVAEIQSQGLEILFYDYYNSLYGNSGKSEMFNSLYNMTASVIDASLYSEWQEAVYSEKDLTVDKCNTLFKEFCTKYNVDSYYGCDENAGYLWIIVNHNFEAPMYYISYGVSAMAALELFAEPDRAAAIDKYMKLSAEGEHVDFKSTLEKCGFGNVFAESTFSTTVNEILRCCGLGYTDITSRDWYFAYTLLANDYIDAYPSNDKFSPDVNATRETFVASIGKLTDDIDGITDTQSPFADTDNKYIAWAASKGIAAGIDETEFGGELPLTREQAVCFIYRFAGSPKSNGSKNPEFTDADDISDWAKEAVAWASAVGIVSGYEDGSFEPKANVSRAETAVLVSMMYVNYETLTNYK